MKITPGFGLGLQAVYMEVASAFNLFERYGSKHHFLQVALFVGGVFLSLPSNTQRNWLPSTHGNFLNYVLDC